MAIASHEGRPIAISYGFVWRDTYYEYQGGWDISYANLRVGKVLSGETIRLAQLQGLRALDYLRGTESYKYSWGATDVVDETWLLPRGLSGWLLAQKFRVARAEQARDARRAERGHPRTRERRHSNADASRDADTRRRLP